jgi:hypothetical protein
MISEDRNLPAQDIGKLSHSEGVPGIKVKAAIVGKKTERAKKDVKKVKRTNMSEDNLGIYEKRRVRVVCDAT